MFGDGGRGLGSGVTSNPRASIRRQVIVTIVSRCGDLEVSW
jgi:hypothetical protein